MKLFDLSVCPKKLNFLSWHMVFLHEKKEKEKSGEFFPNSSPNIQIDKERPSIIDQTSACEQKYLPTKWIGIPTIYIDFLLKFQLMKTPFDK